MKVQTDFIRKNLSSFPNGFVNCVVRTFEQVKRIEGYGEALPVSVMLYIAAKKYGLPAKICMGTLTVQGKDTFSAWCRVGDIIIDPAVFGLTNYVDGFNEDRLPLGSNINYVPMPVPFIGTKITAAFQRLIYQEDEFDEDWDNASIRWAYGFLVSKYLANAPDNCMMERLSEVLNKKNTSQFANEIYNLVGTDRIGIQNSVE